MAFPILCLVLFQREGGSLLTVIMSETAYCVVKEEKMLSELTGLTLVFKSKSKGCLSFVLSLVFKLK